MKTLLIIFTVIILADSFGIINQSESIHSEYVSAKQLSSEVNTEFTMIPLEELLNKRFNRLTIIGKSEPKFQPSGQSKRMVTCICDCGNTTIVSLINLKTGHTQSCGCGKGSSTHKLSTTRIYTIRKDMGQRCYNPNNSAYKNYGGRGIKICEEWLNDFQVFYDWAIANGYEEGLQIDRKNNNGNYEPKNCRWTTHKENNRNTSRTKLTMEKAKVIRNLYALGKFTMKEIGIVYDVKKGTIGSVINNKTWT